MSKFNQLKSDKEYKKTPTYSLRNACRKECMQERMGKAYIALGCSPTNVIVIMLSITLRYRSQ